MIWHIFIIEGDYACVGAGSMWEISIPLSQYCHKPNTYCFKKQIVLKRKFKNYHYYLLKRARVRMRGRETWWKEFCSQKLASATSPWTPTLWGALSQALHGFKGLSLELKISLQWQDKSVKSEVKLKDGSNFHNHVISKMELNEDHSQKNKNTASSQAQ